MIIIDYFLESPIYSVWLGFGETFLKRSKLLILDIPLEVSGGAEYYWDPAGESIQG